jgi:hypothetical protein
VDKKTDFGGVARKWATGFSIEEKGYLGQEPVWIQRLKIFGSMILLWIYGLENLILGCCTDASSRTAYQQ